MKFFLILLLFSLTSPSFAIKKCKDVDGKWHYGDTAVEQCENSQITTLDNRGFITEEEGPPKTAEELVLEAETQALLDEEEGKRLAAEEQRRRVLSIYETESDIDRLRDNQLDSEQSNIDVHKAYLKGIDTRITRNQAKLAETENKGTKQKLTTAVEQAKLRVTEFELELALLQQQKKDIAVKFAKEKELYLALKSGEE